VRSGESRCERRRLGKENVKQGRGMMRTKKKELSTKTVGTCSGQKGGAGTVGGKWKGAGKKEKSKGERLDLGTWVQAERLGKHRTGGAYRKEVT